MNLEKYEKAAPLFLKEKYMKGTLLEIKKYILKM